MKHGTVVCFVFFLLHLVVPHRLCFGPTVENVKEVLKLSVEQKGAQVPIGELTVYLNGPTVTDQEELATLTNGNAANGTSEYTEVWAGCHFYIPQGSMGQIILKHTSKYSHVM